MAKVHHGLTVGMASANAKVTGTATQAELTAQFVDIYNGDPISPFQACNAVWAFVPDDGWWGATGANEQELNANGWTNWLKAVRDANEQVGGGNLKGNISRNLAGLLSGGDPAHTVNPCVIPPNAGWTEGQLEDYAEKLCDNIVADGLEDCVGAWYLDDEGMKHLWYPDFGGVDAVIRAAEIVHGVQKSRGLNIPFQIAEELTIESGRKVTVCNGTTPVQEELGIDRLFWVNADPWEFQTPAKLKERIDAFFDPQSVLDGASVVFLPFFYPWAGVQTFWRYRRSYLDNGVLNDVFRNNPPWMVWQTALDTFQQDFPKATYDRLEFQPVTEASRQSPIPVGMYPRHVDLHKVTRVLLDLRSAWAAASDSRFSGIWYLGWTKAGRPAGEAAQANWTQPLSYRYAEAIQNEIGASTEGLPQVWKDGGANITTEIQGVVEDDPPVSVPPPDVPMGVTPRAWRIEYRLAPTTITGSNLVLGTGRTLGKRGTWDIEIWRSAVTPLLVRTITEGFDGPSPHGRYEGDALTEGDVDFGTSAYWDGVWDDSGGVPGKDGTLAGLGAYTAILHVDGVTEDSVAFEWL